MLWLERVKTPQVRLAEAQSRLKAAIEYSVAKKSFRGCISLCGETRAVYDMFETLILVDPSAAAKELIPVQEQLKLALGCLWSVNEGNTLDRNKTMDVLGMISNTEHRLRKLEAITKPGSIKSRLQDVRLIGSEMVANQRRIKEGREVVSAR